MEAKNNYTAGNGCSILSCVLLLLVLFVHLVLSSLGRCGGVCIFLGKLSHEVLDPGEFFFDSFLALPGLFDLLFLFLNYLLLFFWTSLIVRYGCCLRLLNSCLFPLFKLSHVSFHFYPLIVRSVVNSVLLHVLESMGHADQ